MSDRLNPGRFDVYLAHIIAQQEMEEERADTMTRTAIDNVDNGKFSYYVLVKQIYL